MFRDEKLFGSKTRTSVLILIALLEDSYPTELAQLIEAKLYTIQKICESLESEGVLVSRLFGRTRQLTLNPRYAAAKELHALLWSLGANRVDLQKAAATKRRRGRRSGKPGL